MTYSLARFRHSKPSVPFQLGGVFGRSGDRFFLADALGTMWLRGSSDIFVSLNPGDLISVEVTDIATESLNVRSARRIHPAVGASAQPKNHVIPFSDFVERVRMFFLRRGLTQVMTPTLVRCPGLEPALEPFSTTISRGRESLTVYLPTSPEVSLKKAMTQGFTDIFEIKNCFRREEFSPHHESEFLMLEWYRGFADLDLILSDLEQLLDFLREAGFAKQDRRSVVHTDFASLFRTTLKFELSPATSALEFRELCHRLAIETSKDDSFADLFHRLLIERIEPALKEMGPTIVRRFPPSMAALAKLDKDGWADRIEFYWNGLEIANGFNEVTDPALQAERWQDEALERRRLSRSTVPEDPALIRALKKGLPPSGGIALGLERLYMACSGCTEIRDLRLFSSEELFSI